MNLTKLKEIYKETKLLYPGYGLMPFAKRITFIAFSLPLLDHVSSWLKADNNPLLVREFANLPVIREFFFRPYVNNNWNSVERMDAITRHYLLVSKCVPIFDVPLNKCIFLLTFDLNGHHFKVVLHKPDWMVGEGEIALSLFYEDLGEIYSVMLTLSGTPSNLKLIVGCIQGVDRDGITDRYRELTKVLFGMRPRDLIVKLAKILAKDLGCKELLCVSNAAHRSKRWYSKSYKYTCYDTIWIENGGIYKNNGFYSLSSGIEKRIAKDIPTKKRANYKKRYEFLDQLELQMKQAIDNPSQTKPIEEAYQKI